MTKLIPVHLKIKKCYFSGIEMDYPVKILFGKNSKIKTLNDCFIFHENELTQLNLVDG